MNRFHAGNIRHSFIVQWALLLVKICIYKNFLLKQFFQENKFHVQLSLFLVQMGLSLLAF